MLTDVQRAILDFEAEAVLWKFAGAKETAIRERFDLSATRYFQVLTAALREPDALAYDARTVRRLLRVQDAKRTLRTR